MAKALFPWVLLSPAAPGYGLCQQGLFVDGGRHLTSFRTSPSPGLGGRFNDNLIALVGDDAKRSRAGGEDGLGLARLGVGGVVLWPTS